MKNKYPENRENPNRHQLRPMASRSLITTPRAGASVREQAKQRQIVTVFGCARPEGHRPPVDISRTSLPSFTLFWAQGEFRYIRCS